VRGLVTGWIRGRQARMMPRRGSRAVKRKRSAQLYVMSRVLTRWIQTMRMMEMTQMLRGRGQWKHIVG
jgi:hypothetical protein